MDDSPYRSPRTVTESTSQVSEQDERERLRRVAKSQRTVMLALLARLISSTISLLSPMFSLTREAAVQWFILTISVGTVIFAMTAVYRLAKEFFSAGFAVVCSCLMLLPFVALLVLLIISQKASNLLQQNGIPVGLLGVNPDNVQ